MLSGSARHDEESQNTSAVWQKKTAGLVPGGFPQTLTSRIS